MKIERRRLKRQKINFAPKNTHGLQIFREEWRIGGRRKTYWKYGLPDGVVVAPFTAGKIIAIREWMPGPNATYMKLIGETMRKGEDALTAAKRGLREETGYVSYRWELLSSVLENSGKSDRLIHIVLAQECERVSNEEKGIEVILMPPKEFWRQLTGYLFTAGAHGGGNTLKGTALAFQRLGIWKL